jgi:hypothetical protein
MMRARSMLAIASTLPMVLSCGNDRLVGNSSETENTISARAISVDSILPAWNHPSSVPTVGTLRLDSSNFDFSLADSTGSGVAMRRLDGTRVPYRRVFWDKQARMARFDVRIDVPLLSGGSRFKLLLNKRPTDVGDSSAVWLGVPDSQKLALTSVLVDSFEHGTLLNMLPAQQYWYSSALDSATIGWFALVSAGAGRSGNALGIGYATTRSDSSYAVVGTKICASGVRSLRSLDSLVVWVRGSGTLSIAFDHLTGSTGPKAWAHYALDSNWTRIRLRPQDLDTADNIGKNRGWAAVRDSVTNLTFLVRGGTGLWIDDIRLHGVDRDDLH